MRIHDSYTEGNIGRHGIDDRVLHCVPSDHVKLHESRLLHNRCIQERTRIEPAQLNLGCTRDVACLVPCGSEEEDPHAQDVHQFATVALLALWVRAVRHVPRMLLKKTGSAASSRSRLLLFLQITEKQVFSR